MSRLTQWMDATFYPEYTDDWDNKRLREYILERLDASYFVLDLGAGRGAVREMDFRGLVQFVAGVDPDPAVRHNPFLDESKTLRLPDGRIPYDDRTFDLVLANNVLEHLHEPQASFREVCRVLKPNGLFVGKTPNTRHYVATIARLTPHRFHEFVNLMRGWNKADTFRTEYKCNTPESIRRCALHAGLAVEDIQLWEGRPEYLRLSALTYLAGLCYERVVNTFQALRRFRCVIVFALRKPGDD